MNNNTTGPTQHQLGVQGNPVAVSYPNLVTAPNGMATDNVVAAQQQMSYLMNSGIMANPLFQQQFLLSQQQQQQQQQVIGGVNNNMNQQQQQQAVSAASSAGGFDLSQMMNFTNNNNTTTQPLHTPSAAFGTLMGSTSTAMVAPVKLSNKRSTMVSDENSSKVGKTDRAKLNRDRNREHARSTRERKKAYVQKLRELVEKLHAERNEESRKRRVAVQHLAEIHRVRCDVVNTFFRYHSKCELDERRWTTILEDDFWLKQPVTPYRSFHRAEIEKECRISRGVQAMISDSASVSVMIEMIGHLTPRWAQIKRQQFIAFESSHRNSSESGSTLTSQQRSIPRCLTHQESRSQRVFSSMSSSDDLSSVENPVETDNSSPIPIEGSFMGPSKSNSDDQDLAHHLREDRSISSSDRNLDEHDASKDFHDYNAMPLPDPKIKDREKRNNSDTSSSGEDSHNTGSLPLKRRKMDQSIQFDVSSLPSNIAKKGGISHNITSTNDANLVEKAVSSLPQSSTTRSQLSTPQPGGMAKLPSNIAKKGGISHNIRPIGVGGDGESRLDSAPAIVLPPFRGLGNKSSIISSGSNVKGDNKSFKTMSSSTPSIAPFSVSSSDVDIDSMRSRTTASEAKTPSLTTTDVEESSSSDDGDACVIRGSYHINQDSQILMGDVLMCPFVFRSHDAVLCGSLSECMMPGMLRAEFSSRNKLKNLELTFDAMGFMQQLARASGNDSTAQIVPSSVEMALIPNATEARVITLAKPPYRVMNVNEQWTRLTGYTQMDAEGKEYLSLIEGEHTLSIAKSRNGMPRHVLEDVAKGRPACSTNIHHGKDGTDFLEFVCSFPLTNDSEEVTHILHISKELPTMIRESDY